MSKRIIGFWHMYLINDWYSIIFDQLRIMIASGLYTSLDVIYIHVVGTYDNIDLLQKLILQLHRKLQVASMSQNPLRYEFPTLELIENQINPNYVGFYIHTKGVTFPNDVTRAHWRSWLNESILHRWKRHYHNVCNGWDVSSVNYCKPPTHPKHFSGNFWWFNGEYIKSLPKLSRLNQKNRFLAEQWICKADGKFISEGFVEPGKDPIFIL